MRKDEERAIGWVVIAVGLLIFIFASWADDFGNRASVVVSSGEADYIWKMIQQQRNSIITRIFGILLTGVGCVLRISAALESK